MGSELFFHPECKMGSKIIEKHCLEKLFESLFRAVTKPYKTNGKLTFPKKGIQFRGGDTIEKPYKTCGKRSFWVSIAKCNSDFGGGKL